MFPIMTKINNDVTQNVLWAVIYVFNFFKFVPKFLIIF